ncbi:hypothetical protein KQI88_10415 [Alkaliphilus sp. MSJ-5]|uniref:Uncharacterized protein n=1 Tax=Alkaliphilus flagellatus TaxID=2841507 RepID=A0ABS6G554_9FIRM|nr:hypothetical protein [Alkaliphilus flagellatus]MBU5676832.1 hypothetical protein [Alkaliphilus flagellatus]
MKTNINKKIGVKLLVMLLIFQAVFTVSINTAHAKSYYGFSFSYRTGKGYMLDGIEEKYNMSQDSFYFEFRITNGDDAPYGKYKITSVEISMDSAMPLHDRYLKTDWGTFQLRDAKREWNGWERDYSDSVRLNKIVELKDRHDAITFRLDSDESKTTGVTSFGTYVDATIYFELIEEYKPNTEPVVSIIQPSNGQSFLKYQKPTIRYNAYDIDGDRMTGTTSVYSNGRWQTIDTRAGIRNGDTVTVDMTDSVWKSLQSNTDLIFEVDLYDGELSDTKRISIKKLNNLPSVTITEPTQSLTLRTDQPPTVKARVSDADGDVLSATLQYLDGSTWRDAVTNTNLASGETTSLKMIDSVWKSLSFNKEYQLRVKVNDGDSDGYSSNVARVTKINTAPNVAILKPVQNEKMFWGYLPFTWQINDIDNDNINLKIWTDTPNIVNNGVLYHGSIGKSPYTNNYLSRAYLPLGKHKIYFEFKDGYHTIERNVTIDIEDIANIHINDNDTFYIPIFNMEKSDIYYRRINNALDAKKYIFNVLELPINKNYVRNIQGIENVTGDNDYTNNGNRLFTLDSTLDPKKVADWIYSKVNSTDNPLIKVVETGNKITLKNIEFEDEEKDYTTAVPVPRGKDRQFKFEHYPQIYENADSEITKNGEWLRDDTFTIFDTNPVVRDGEDITITLSKSGRYIVSAKEKDSIFNPAGIDFSKESKPKDIELYAHRRPVAKISYIDNGNDTINLESKSYDLDFETRADKGIQQEIWQYRFVGYDDTIIQDWKPITSLKGFRPNINYKTDIRLTVKDYGARLDLANDGELTATDIITIDATGKPPIAAFEYKVGTTLANSIMADGEVYKGNAGKETLQLDPSYTIWNDFFGKAATRQITWSKSQAQLNNEIPSSSSLTTTLTVRNKYNLTDSITKLVDVKDIKINDNSSLINNNKNFNVNVNLSSSKFMNKWGNFKLVLTSNDLETTSIELDNVFSNRFTKNNVKVMDRNADNKLDYTVSVYSKRTGELISRENYSLILNRPPTVSISISPSKLYEGDSAKVSVLANDPDLDKLNLEVRHRVNNGKWKTIWTKNNVNSGTKQSFDMHNLVAGNNELMVIATDPYNATGTDKVSFQVLPIKVYGNLRPNPAMAGDQVLFFITTEGYVDKIEIVVPDDIISKDNRSAMGYSSVKYPLTFNVDGSLEIKEDIFKYIVWVSTDLTLDKNNNRLRSPYRFIVRGYKGDIIRETELELDIKGDVRELLKPGIKNKYRN